MSRNADKSRSTLALIVVILATFGLAPPASAEESTPPAAGEGGEGAAEDAEFDGVVAQAVEHYQAQRYDLAIEHFQRAYALRPQPELIYNIARVYERSVRPREALENYERFLSLPNTTSELRTRAATSVASLRREIAAIEQVDRDQPSTTTTPPSTPPPVTQPPPPEPRDGLGAAGWALLGVGAATLAAGVVMGALTLSEQTRTEDATSLAEQNTHFDRGTTFALATDVLFGAGGALAIAAMVLLIVRATRQGSQDEVIDTPYDSEATLHFSPLFSREGGLGLSLGGLF